MFNANASQPLRKFLRIDPSFGDGKIYASVRFWGPDDSTGGRFFSKTVLHDLCFIHVDVVLVMIPLRMK